MSRRQELLATWAQAHRLTNHPVIVELQDTLSNAPTIAWSAADLSQLLPARPPAKRNNLHLLQFVYVLRGMLIFLPVALTWYAISQATSAFGTFVAETASTTTNFLEFWQGGFGYLAPEWRLSFVALLDCVIVLLVILLTIAISVSNFRHAEEQERLNTAFENSRQLLVLQLSSERPESNLREADQSLAAASRLIAELSSQVVALGQTAQAITSSLGRVDQVASAVGGQVEAMQRAVEQLSRGLQAGLATQADAATRTGAATSAALSSLESFSQDLEALRRSVAAAAGQISSEVEAGLETLSRRRAEGERQLEQSAREVSREAQQVVRSLMEFRENIDKFFKA